MSTWEVIHGDCLEVLRGMPDASVDAVATDPPYFRVKSEAWDRQWGHDGAYLDWLSSIIDEWWRVLRSNGSVYCFASPQMAARVEVRIGQRFNVLNTITWQKPPYSTKAEMCDKSTMRGFFPASERIIFAEHYFEPLRLYLASERDRAGWTTRRVAEEYQKVTGSRTVTGMAGHWFERVQWALPTAANYQWLRQLFNQSGGDYLRREYEDLRRPFAVTPDVPYTDVWTFKTVQAYKGKHPCEKPVDMMEHIIRTSTKPGAVVLDCFAGSGSTGVACARNDRSFIGIEKDESWADYASRRIAEAANNLYVGAK